MKNRIIAANGSVQEIDEIPQPIKELYKTVWELKQKSIIDLAATRAPFVDQTQSMNLWMKDPSYSKLSSMHMYSWMKGLKTGIYYLRTQAKSSAAKISLDQEKMDVKNNNSDNSSHQQAQPQTHVQPKEEPECLMCSA
jgi:ribonucleotide reductase alpha subunit